jgi:hypothetical protein
MTITQSHQRKMSLWLQLTELMENETSVTLRSVQCTDIRTRIFLVDFSNVHIAYRLYLTIPVSTEVSEK